MIVFIERKNNHVYKSIFPNQRMYFEGYISTREPITVRFRNDASGVSIYKENVKKWPKFRNFDQLTKFRMSHIYVTGYWELSYFFRMWILYLKTRVLQTYLQALGALQVNLSKNDPFFEAHFRRKNAVPTLYILLETTW